MYHPATRVLTVLELLQSRAHLSGGELADRLQVDRRTVRRYIGTLKDLGVPVESQAGRAGGYRLRPGFKLPPMMFTEEEALALVVGLLISRRVGIGDAAPAVEGALAKIDRVLPDRLRGRVQAVQGALAFTPLRGLGQLPPAATLLTLTTAADSTRRVWLRYQGMDDQTERSIDPYGVVHHRGRWYAVGWCHLRNDVRMFRLDRVLALEALEESFVRPLDFDCAAYVVQSLANVPWGWPIEVLFEMPLDEARRRIAPDLGTLQEVADGVIFQTQAEELEWMARLLVEIGCGFRILHPPALRAAVVQLARDLGRQARKAPRRPVHRAGGRRVRAARLPPGEAPDDTRARHD